MTTAIDRSLIERTLRLVIDLLVEKAYVDLERLTNGVRLKALEIEAGVVDYGRTLVPPPAEALSNLDMVRVHASASPAYSIRFRLHTLEEGVSDLELQATFIEREPGTMRVEIDNIVVA